MKALAEYELSYQLSAGKVDPVAGYILGATVAKAGVQATGKYIFIDANGKITRDEKLSVKKLPVFTDEMTLATIMTAAAADGGEFRVRSDHSDDLAARAGVALNFRREGDRVSTDIRLNTSYRDRDIVLETAAKNPKLIGLSIDMVPSFEIDGDKAYMRIEKLVAVDIVDEGAITHEGMFLHRGVDNAASIKLTHKFMADPKPTAPTIEECMSRLSKLADDFSAMQASIAKMGTPPAAAAPAAGDAELKASVTKLTEQMNGINEFIISLKRTPAALGLKAGAGAAPGGDEVEAERLRLAAEKTEADKIAAAAKPKSYDEQVAELTKDGKMKRSDAHRAVMASDPKAYQTKLAAQGVLRMTA